MIDLTPLDVRKKRGDFRRILRGYDPVEVDTFLELVEDRLEALVLENLALSEKTSRLESSLKTLGDRESAVQDALVMAQKLREEVRQQSEREVDLLKRETHSELDRLRRDTEAQAMTRLREVEGMIREGQRALEELERNRRKFLKSFRTLLERELDSVEVEEARLPLEDAPLDLELRGWRPPARDAAPGTEEGVGGEGPPGEGDPEPESPEGEGSAAGGPVLVEEALETPGDESRDREPGKAAEYPAEVLSASGGVGGDEVAEGVPAAPEEPLWLSSLLKQGNPEVRRPEE